MALDQVFGADGSSIVFRVDASERIGSGHLMRCLTLADYFRDQGCNISFICRELPGNLIAVAESRGYRVYRLPQPTNIQLPRKMRLTHESWLGVDWQTDAGETIAVLRNMKQRVHWLIVDHYAIDTEWESKVKADVNNLMVIDDLTDRKHNCSILLNQNFGYSSENSYQTLVPKGCKLLLGPQYALIRPEFSRLRQQLPLRNGDVRRMIVFFGGADLTNETGKALDAIKDLTNRSIELDVIVGASNPHKEEIMRQCFALNANFYCQTDRMAELMARADLAIGACGTATWERCCVGLPAICTIIAENQTAIAYGVAEYGAIINLGIAESVTQADIKEKLTGIFANPKKLYEMSEKAYNLVDGCGTTRVGKELGMLHYKVTIASDATSWMNEYIPVLITGLEERGCSVRWTHQVKDIAPGDFVFLLGCGTIVSAEILKRNKHNLVVHASALPQGKGMSPLTWQILEGKNDIPVALFEADPELDCGDIYIKNVMHYKGTELIDEMRIVLGDLSIKMCLDFVDKYPDILATKITQQGEPSFYRRRTKADSALDINKTIAEQFNLLRVVDNESYPAFFEYQGCTYYLKVYRKQDK